MSDPPPAPTALALELELPIRYGDLDPLGHVNQAVYHVFLEEVRAGLLARALGEEGGWAWVLARVELDHRHEIRHAHRHVVARARIGRVGTSSVELEHELSLPDGTVAAAGRSVLVAWDAGERRSRQISELERRALRPS